MSPNWCHWGQPFPSRAVARISGPLKEYWYCPRLFIAKDQFYKTFFLSLCIIIFSLFFCSSMFLTVPDAIHPFSFLFFN
uniref:Uncharacterized protein n=1 Tax=Anguilla anguilla TaxID=7936 RepID=A0A0E9WZR4_ANGAN